MLLVEGFFLIIGRIFLIDENLFYLGLFCRIFCLEDVHVLQVKMQQHNWSSIDYVHSKLIWLFSYLPKKREICFAMVVKWFQNWQMISWFYHVVVVGWQRKFFIEFKLVNVQKEYLLDYYAQYMVKLFYFCYYVDFSLEEMSSFYYIIRKLSKNGKKDF
jgi:hypothetical protein